MMNFLKSIFKKGELRQRIIFTLGILFVFRLGAAITIPSIEADALTGGAANSGIFGLMNLIGGGQLERFSIFSLGVSPYITASIIIELLSMDVIPVLTQWSKEGNNGKKKKDRVTRYLTVVLAAIQGGSLTYAFDKGYNILADNSFLTYAYVVVVMIAGSMLAMWLGDQITNKGIGNGISVIIFAGIVSSLPQGVVTLWNLIMPVTGFSTVGLITAIAIILGAVLLVAGVVFVQQAERRVPVQYSKRVVGRKMVGGQ